jgi:hypothetical protein
MPGDRLASSDVGSSVSADHATAMPEACRPWLCRVILGAFLAIVVVVATGACGGDPPRAPTPLRPIDEAHAASIIAHAIRAVGFTAEKGRSIHLTAPNGTEMRELKLDVAAKGKQWGIAYITTSDGEQLGDVLPRSRDPERFTVVHGAGDGEDATRAVLLFAGDYMEDDLAGDDHTQTSIAAEEKLDIAARKIAREALDANWP